MITCTQPTLMATKQLRPHRKCDAPPCPSGPGGLIYEMIKLSLAARRALARGGMGFEVEMVVVGWVGIGRELQLIVFETIVKQSQLGARNKTSFPFTYKCAKCVFSRGSLQCADPCMAAAGYAAPIN
jgi:hypothetical protein